MPSVEARRLEIRRPSLGYLSKGQIDEYLARQLEQNPLSSEYSELSLAGVLLFLKLNYELGQAEQVIPEDNNEPFNCFSICYPLGSPHAKQYEIGKTSKNPELGDLFNLDTLNAIISDDPDFALSNLLDVDDFRLLQSVIKERKRDIGYYAYGEQHELF
jgi:hypothetical protein